VRSKLFVPGSRPALFAKALAGNADGISFDLEDSVIESRKAEARECVAGFLQGPEVGMSRKIIIVRCNALHTAHFEADVLAIAQPGLTILNVPKVESPDEVRRVAAALARAEAANGVERPIRILATIESPEGLRAASEIARADRRLAGLQLGLSDLFDPLGIDRYDSGSAHAAMFAMRLAAGSSGVFAYDGAFADIGDKQGFRAEAKLARRLGYLGKTCIHPGQVEAANEVFAPSKDELAFAQRVVDAAREAEARGLGAFTVDGKMIDLPAIRRAEMILARTIHESSR
jgi:citrate lyase subunit beta/citryl-CoA lyase